MWAWTLALMVLALLTPATAYVLKAPAQAPVTHEPAIKTHSRRSRSPGRPSRATALSMKCEVECGRCATLPVHEHTTERHVSWVPDAPAPATPRSTGRSVPREGAAAAALRTARAANVAASADEHCQC